MQVFEIVRTIRVINNVKDQNQESRKPEDHLSNLSFFYVNLHF